MMEDQALSRVHRMGQKKDVKVIRYIMKDSFEEVRQTRHSPRLFFYSFSRVSKL